MMRIQIPELQENRIEIKDIARVAGFKTKVSVISHQPSIDPTGAIIGQRGQRINAVRDLIDNSKNEKIEVIEYSDDFTTYIINVCSPAEISGFAVTEPKAPEDRKQIVLVARDDKLALLIGKRGCNVRLISDLLNADIEIRSVQEAQETNLEYTHIDMSKMRQQGFNKTFNKYKTSNDMFNRYKTAKVNLNYGESEEQIKSKNMKTSILDEFKKMDKKDLDETLSQVDTDNNDDDINDHDEY
jgi:N utilization substance protein A